MSGRTVYRYIGAAYCAMLEREQDYFDKQIAFWFDQSIGAVQEIATLLGDRFFLENADPVRIVTCSKVFGEISDRVFVLMAAAERGWAARLASASRAK